MSIFHEPGLAVHAPSWRRALVYPLPSRLSSPLPSLGSPERAVRPAVPFPAPGNALLDTPAGQSKCLCLPVQWLEWIYLALECSAFPIINCLAMLQGGLGSAGFCPCPQPFNDRNPTGSPRSLGDRLCFKRYQLSKGAGHPREGMKRQSTYQAGLSARGRPCPQVWGAWKKSHSCKNPSGQQCLHLLPSLMGSLKRQLLKTLYSKSL